MRSITRAILLSAVLAAPGLVVAQPAPAPPPPPPPPVAQPTQAPPAPPAPQQPPPQQPPPQLPPQGMPMQPVPPAQPPPPGFVPQGWGAPPSPEIITMPPGYLEQPGRFPRTVPVEDLRVPPPLGYRVDKEPRKPLWLSGTIIFTISHAITGLTGGGLFAGGDNEYEKAWLLMVPVIGPVLWSPLTYGIDSDDARATFAGMSLITAVQATGLGLMIGGFALRRPIYKRNDVATSHGPSEVETSVTLLPGPGGATLQIDF